MCCLILDTGLRIAEALRLDADLERLVPFSFGLRRLLWRYLQRSDAATRASAYLFPTRNGTRTTVRNFQRDFKLLCEALPVSGVRASPHTLRHTFAVGYLRNGGDVYYLSKILGHIQSCWARGSASLRWEPRHAHSSSSARKQCRLASSSVLTRSPGL